VHVPPSYEVVACERCGFVYADQAIAQGDLDRDNDAHSKYAANVTDVVVAPASATTVAKDAAWDARRLTDVASHHAYRHPPPVCVLDACWSRRARSRKELMNLSDRGLNDIGIARHSSGLKSCKPFWMA